MKVRTEERRKEKVFEEYTLVEKALPPYMNWMVRKLFLRLCIFLLTVSKVIANRFRFEYEGTVSDREEWIWLNDFSWKGLFSYRARVEKVD